MRPFPLYLVGLSCLLFHSIGHAQHSDTIVVRGHRREDGCVALDGALGPHGLPAEPTVSLRTERLPLALTTPATSEFDTPRARIEHALLHQLLPIGNSVVRSLLNRWQHMNGHGDVHQSGTRVLAQIRFDFPEPVPLLGYVSLPFTAEARHCPVSYQLPSSYGPLPCTGRRTQILVGPRDGRMAGFVQALVLDHCFNPRGNELERRWWLVRGVTRSIPPLLPEQRLQSYVSTESSDILEDLVSAITTQAQVHAGGTRRDDTPVHPIPRPASTPDLRHCAATVSALTARYYALFHAADYTARWDPVGESLLWNLFVRRQYSRAAESEFLRIERPQLPRTYHLESSSERGNDRYFPHQYRLCRYLGGNPSIEQCTMIQQDNPVLSHRVTVTERLDAEDPSSPRFVVMATDSQHTSLTSFANTVLPALQRTECLSRVVPLEWRDAPRHNTRAVPVTRTAQHSGE